MWVPPGFGQGFLVLSDTADPVQDHRLLRAGARARLLWNDEHVNVAWPLQQVGDTPTLSGKDAVAKQWRDVELFD
jgi:dTDP-4-dehydrorhamnose 3,5-epimerase